MVRLELFQRVDSCLDDETITHKKHVKTTDVYLNIDSINRVDVWYKNFSRIVMDNNDEIIVLGSAKEIVAYIKECDVNYQQI